MGLTGTNGGDCISVRRSTCISNKSIQINEGMHMLQFPAYQNDRNPQI